MKNPLSKAKKAEMSKEDEREYVIITDTASDLSQQMLLDLNVTALPMHVIIDDVDYLHYADYRNLSNVEFFEKLEQCNDIKTTQIDPENAESTMKSFLEEGKNIIYIAFSSGLSGTYSTGAMIAEDLKEEFPESRIKVIDSLCASGGEGLLVFLAAAKRDEGLSFDELVKWIEDTKLHIGHWFTVNDLQHLRKGGRISAATAAIGGLLSIKPVMHMDDEGHLTPNCKCSGRKKSLDLIVDKMNKHTKGKKFDAVFISQAECLDDAQLIKDKLNEKFKIKNIHIVDIDPIIAAHTGSGCISLFFVGEER